jgi:hypothetical protein
MTTQNELRYYSVKPMREAGLEAKWTKTRRGTPIIVARYPKAEEKHQRERFWFVDTKMFNEMQKSGVIAGFERATLLACFFSV